MQITTISGGYFKLDGGAMFGIVPRRLWQKLNPPDENNLCTWALRCLLIETGERKILVDCGIGDKQDERWRSFFEPHGEATIEGELLHKGLRPEDITDVFLTHLHFDHCGGAVVRDNNGRLLPAFPNATYWSNELQWNWALHPNERERASFLKENFVPLQEAGCLRFLDVQKDELEWLPGLSVKFFYGHTEALMALIIRYGQQRFIYCSDLLPSSYHVGRPYIMAYDIRPLVTLEEKDWLLETALTDDYTLIFEHDPGVAFGTLTKSDTGRIVIKDAWM